MENTIAYVSIMGNTYRIEASTHASYRAEEREEREEISNSFIVGRLETLLNNEDVVNTILDGIRINEKFIIEDKAMGYSIAVALGYDRIDSMDTLTAITMRSKLRIADGQKILSIYKNNVKLAIWHAANRKREIIISW